MITVFYHTNTPLGYEMSLLDNNTCEYVNSAFAFAPSRYLSSF
jgi:hypothetical protein